MLAHTPKRYLLLLLTFFLFSTALFSTTIQQLTHYSVDDGLSENHILCMHQDQKGTLWFGTYYGLDKFDGYNFSSFRGKAWHKYRLANYRINRIREDKQGFLWIQTNDDRIYRFDPSTESFLPVPQCVEKYSDYKAPLNRIHIMADGSIWLMNGNKENADCFRVTNSTDGQIALSYFSKSNGMLSAKYINLVYTDRDSNTWLLTSEGLSQLKKNSREPVSFFRSQPSNAMISVLETPTKLCFGGEQGTLLEVDRHGNRRLLHVPSLANIIDIKPLSANEILLITSSNDFYVWKLNSDTFIPYRINGALCTVYGAYMDKKGNCWIDSNRSLGIRFDLNNRTIHYLSVDTTKFVNQQTTKFYALEDKQKLLLQIRSGGLYLYNPQNDKLESVYNTAGEDLSGLIHSAMLDYQGNLWYSTYLQGVDKLVFHHSPFNFRKPLDIRGFSMQNEVRALCSDRQQRLWVGTKKGQLWLYDRNGQLIGITGPDGRMNTKSVFNAAPYCIAEDHAGRIWVATKGQGLFLFQPRDSKTFSVTNFCYNPDDIYSLSNDAVYSIHEDRHQRLWIATYGGGVNLVDESSGNLRFINHRNRLKNYPIDKCGKVRYITEDKAGQVLAGTTQGLLCFDPDKINPEAVIFRRFVHNPDDNKSISGNDIQYVLSTRKGDIYLAMIGGGVNRIKGGIRPHSTPEFTAVGNKDGQMPNAFYTLAEDKAGHIWMSGQTQIVRYDVSSGKVDTYKPTSPEAYFFDEAAMCQTAQGEIVYGTSNGFVRFDPLTIRKSSFRPSVSLTRLWISGHIAEAGAENSPLQKTIDQTAKLVLSHSESTFSIEFAALDYSNPQTIQYAYKLDGLESDWNYSGNQRVATYINLPKGTYTFRVRSTNADGQWVDNEKTVIVEKLPSFWESVWGIIFYFCLIILFALLVAYVLFVIYKLRNEVHVEQRISNMKLNFFTDISHELRTPLTLIASPIEHILQKETISERVREQLLVVEMNSSRMIRLINQLLDFRKIQHKKMNLIIEQVELLAYMHEITRSFSKLSEEQQIHFRFSEPDKPVILWIDKDKFEKIMFNLLSNAFKYSNKGSVIEIEIHDTETSVRIIVRDFGSGISKEKLRFLFERFESFSTATSMRLQASTGIGLSLTKELVELQHGHISVQSEPGRGSEFVLTFLKGVDHFGENDDFVLEDGIGGSDAPFSNQEEEEYEMAENNELKTALPRILIVEDNQELRTFLRTVLSTHYEVIEADNGRTGLNEALGQMPDLIVSDLMMPDMDGIEFADILKKDINTSHIPVVVLTAKNDVESKLEAMRSGVDDYITKPFSATYLEARIENILAQRKQLQAYFQQLPDEEKDAPPSRPSLSHFDELFMQKTLKYIDENYSNSHMNIEDIANFTGVSRSSFFKKMKTLTGFAPVEYVRDYRIQQARKMFEAGETNVSQVSYNVGIEDPRYFTRCFRLKYGINPSEYKQRANRTRNGAGE